MNDPAVPTAPNDMPGADTMDRPKNPVGPNDTTANEDMVVEGAGEIEAG